MNSNLSANIRNYTVTATIKNRMTRFLCAGVALFVISGGIPSAGADDNNGCLPNQMIVSTVPPNGDLNPYGVALFRKTSNGAMGPCNREIFWSQISTIVRTCRARALPLCVFLGVAWSHFSLLQRLPRQAQPAMAYRQLWQCCARLRHCRAPAADRV